MSAILVWAGVAVSALTAVRLLLQRDHFMRLHFIGPVTVLAVPLVLAGLAVQPWSSWHDVAKLVVIGALLAITGPASVITAARAAMGGRTRNRGWSGHDPARAADQRNGDDADRRAGERAARDARG